MKKKRVAINGFGRIGRTLLRILLEKTDIQVVAINDLAYVKTMAHLFKYDSVHGKWNGHVEATDEALVLNGNSILFFNEKNAENLPWKSLDVDIVVESTGTFKTLEIKALKLT
jgi:glyceraldehyde 3-phosphate dehydrogenase